MIAEIMQAMSQVDIFGPNSLLNNIDPTKIQAALDMFNILGNGKLDVPYWELQAGFKKIAEETGYKSTNPDSEFYDPEAEFTGTQIEDVERDAEGNVVLNFDNLFSEEFKWQEGIWFLQELRWCAERRCFQWAIQRLHHCCHESSERS